MAHNRRPRQTPTPPPDRPTFSILANTSPRTKPAPIPNKHIPICPTGPIPVATHPTAPATPPDTPPFKQSALFAGRYGNCDFGSNGAIQADGHDAFQILLDEPRVYSIDGTRLCNALHDVSACPYPDPAQVFPWLHGLHPENQIQLSFFSPKNKPCRNAQTGLRGLVIVKTGGDLTRSRIKGAISPYEILQQNSINAAFLDPDPQHGSSARNFHIQTLKMAVMSDIVVYHDRFTDFGEAMDLAKRISTAQRNWRANSTVPVLEQTTEDGSDLPFHTFVLSESFEKFGNSFPEMISIEANGQVVAPEVEFSTMERREMLAMSRASEICHNVWLGPTPTKSAIADDAHFDILIDTNFSAAAPELRALTRTAEASFSQPQSIEFPSSGSLVAQSYPRAGQDPILRMCRWIHELANRQGDRPTEIPTDDDSDSSSDSDSNSDSDMGMDSDGDIPMQNLSCNSNSPRPRSIPAARRILIHCTDGYTESTLLAMSYFMYATQLPLHEAWIRLHCDKKRNFFAYPSDVMLLNVLESRLVPQSPLQPTPRHMKSTSSSSAPQKQIPTKKRSHTITLPAPPASGSKSPSWLTNMDGSLPSRVLPYLYLGNIGHANNPDLLRELGITQVLSVGESVSWTTPQIANWGGKERIKTTVLHIDGVQDNGVDPLLGEIARCLAFIKRGRQQEHSNEHTRARTAGSGSTKTKTRTKSTGKDMTGTGPRVRSEGATLVHCRVGVSRSATICIAEVMRALELSFPEAYSFVRARRLNVIIQPHLRFVYELMKWGEGDVSLDPRRGVEKVAVPRRIGWEWASVCREIAALNAPYCSR